MRSRKDMLEATKWLIALETSKDTSELRPAFDNWLKSSKAHRDAYAVVHQAQLQMSKLPTTAKPGAFAPTHIRSRPSADRSVDLDVFLILAMLLALATSAATNILP